jgi:hypothetical protein
MSVDRSFESWHFRRSWGFASTKQNLPVRKKFRKKSRLTLGRSITGEPDRYLPVGILFPAASSFPLGEVFLAQHTEGVLVIRLASICVAILVVFPSISNGQDSRQRSSKVRPASAISVGEQRSGAVPRPTRTAGRLASTRQNPTSLLQDAETVVPSPTRGVPATRHNEGIVEDESIVMEDGGIIVEDFGGCSSCGDTGCSSCSHDSHGAIGPYGIDICNPTGLGGRRLCICLPSHGWASVDYLGWYQAGMQTPALVTSSPAGTLRQNAGVLPGAQVLYGGNDDILTDNMGGIRVRVGVWSATRPNAGAEGEYFGFNQQTEFFEQNSNGNTILARPFYDNVNGKQNAELVAFPDLLSGRVRVDADSQLAAAAVRFRQMLCCSNGCGYSALACAPIQSQSRFDATIGWRYMQLNEGLLVTETLTSLDTGNPGSFLIQDSFRTFNQFNGAEIGVQWLGRRGFWTAETIMRMSLGNTLQRVEVRGTTSIDSTTPLQGGFLAQPGRNIGQFEQQEFAMIPELGATIGYQLTQRLKLNVGYTFLYWSNLARPGDQIDTTVNTNLLPSLTPSGLPQNTFLGTPFAIQTTDYWVQGLSVGGEYRW